MSISNNRNSGKPYRKEDANKSSENRPKYTPRSNSKSGESPKQSDKTARRDNTRPNSVNREIRTKNPSVIFTSPEQNSDLKPTPKSVAKEGVSNEKKSETPEKMRLNKFIANAGICSRREADVLIQKGLITVNGVIAQDMGTIVNPTDTIIYNGSELNCEKKIYVLLNKPKNVVTTREDAHADLTVMDLIRNACTERIYPVGRLDKATTGVLLLTNDGDLTKKLTHPKYEKKKIYHVHLDKAVTKFHMEEISKGIKLEDGDIAADDIDYVGEDKNQVGIEIHSGRNRIVRRIFEHLGYKVLKLDRVYFAGLTKKGLQRGHWRYLTEQEVKLLKAGLLT